MKRIRVAAALFIAAAALHAADEIFPDYAPPGTKVVIGIRVRGILDALTTQGIASGDWQTKASAVLAQTPLAGFDPFKDLDELVIASSGEGQKPPSLMWIRGRFDMERLGKNAQSYHGVPVLGSAQTPDSILALLDSSTAIAGDPPLVHAAIDARGNGAGLDAKLAARIAPLRAKYDLWGLGEQPKPPAPVKGQPPNPFGSVDRFEFGASLSHGFDVAGQIHVRTSEDVQKMQSTFQFLEAMMKQKKQPESAAKFEIHSENGAFRLALYIPPEEFKKAIEAQRATLESAVAAQFGKSNKPEPSSEPKVVTDSNGDTVMITLPGPKKH